MAKYLLDLQETERLYLRKIEPADYFDWLEFFKDASSFRYWPGPLEKPETECARWYARQSDRYDKDEGGMNALIETKSGNLVGHAGLLIQEIDHQTEMEVAYSLLSAFRGRGFATEAARCCRDFAFGNHLTDSLISIISLSNDPSARVAIKNGMVIEKTSVYHGVAVNIFRIRREQWKRF